MTTSGGTPTSSFVWSGFCSGVRGLVRRLPAATARAGGDLAGLLYPPRCALCERPLDALSVVCARCIERLPALEGARCRRCGEVLADPSVDVCIPCGTHLRSVDRFGALGPYDEGWGALVRALKFDREPAVARFLARRMADWLDERGVVESIDRVTFVPMTRRDRRERGFNQAELLARAVARRIGRPASRMLRKVRQTPPQGRLTAAQRRANLRDAVRPIRYAQDRVLLVDDICTTGSTVEACAGALRRGGCPSVTVLTVARA